MNPLPLLKPAFYTHIISALMMLAGLVLVATNYKRIRSDPLHLIMILLLASIAIAIHGHGHVMLEKMYEGDASLPLAPCFVGYFIISSSSNET